MKDSHYRLERMNQHLVWLILWILSGIHLMRIDESKKGMVKVSSKDGPDQRYLSFGAYGMPIIPAVITGVPLLVYGIANDFTFAASTGSLLGLFGLCIPFTFVGLVLRSIFQRLKDGEPDDGPGIVSEIVDALKDDGEIDEDEMKKIASAARRSITGGRATGRLLVLIACFLIMPISSITPMMGNLGYNPMFADLNESVDNTAAPSDVLTDAQDVRVVSWNLAVEYLQRSYGDSAAALDTGEWMMQEYTHPTLVNGEYVWVNAPLFESLKWLGGKPLPFYVQLFNDPTNMSNPDFDWTARSDSGFVVHQTAVTWSNRLPQILHDEYALKYMLREVRFDLDDDLNPYWILYMTERGVIKDVQTLREIVIIDATDIDNRTAYAVDDPNIPEWLEVVYPDYYVEDWAHLWGNWREGIIYHMFTKKHLSTPADAARFIVLNETSYWYVPMQQLNSDVLAGYILVDTRTGEATYHNREAKSFASLQTAFIQVQTYLASGAEGFSQLRIDEGYLYPIEIDSGEVREAYIFPMYSGYSVQKFAIVDAEDYTQTPLLEEDLETALIRYRSRAGPSVQPEPANITWEPWAIENGYIDDEECVVTVNGTTRVIVSSDLGGGVLAAADDEWRELRLAMSEFERGANVTIHVTISSGFVADVDWGGSDLVSRG